MSQQTCKSCGCPDYFDFRISDEVWEAVVPAKLRNRVVCLACFDRFAHEQGVRYRNALRTLYFAGEQECFTFRVA